jgi:hypothetical protein
MNRQGPIRTRIGDRLGSRGRRAPHGAAATWRIEGEPEVAWIKLDDKFAYHRKFRQIEPASRFAAIGTWSAAIGFSQLFETDGRIRPEDLAMLAPPDLEPDPKVIAELVRVRLWDVAGDGWKVHNFEKHNMSADMRAELRARKSAQRQRQRQRKARKPLANPKCRPTVAGDTFDVAPQQTQTETQTERETEYPPTPLSRAAPEATGANPGSLSLVLIPNTETLDDWKLSAVRVRDEIVRRRAADAAGDGRPEEPAP